MLPFWVLAGAWAGAGVPVIVLAVVEEELVELSVNRSPISGGVVGTVGMSSVGAGPMSSVGDPKSPSVG